MPTTVKDYYQKLGISKDASQNEIKKAYRKLARKYHPDLNPGDKTSEEKFKEINEAYAVLGDPQKRAEHDKAGTTFEQFADFRGFGGFDFAEAFDFGNIFGTRFGTESRYARGEDILAGVELSLEEAFTGVIKPISITRTVDCDVCKGTGAESSQACPTCKGTGKTQTSKGFFKTAQTCPECHGTGRKITSVCKKCSGRGQIVYTETVKVKIPAGVDNGSIVKLKGKGNAGKGGGHAGDMLLEIAIKPHAVFNRKGDDVYVQLPVTFGEASFGAKIEVPTIDGAAVMKLPAGTQGGQRFKLSKKGFISPKTKNRGDEYVDIKIAVPKDIPENAKEAINKIEALYKESPRKRMGR
jgi:molecular chaperone DnaJ